MKTPHPDPRIERARYGLILDAPFFGALMVRLPVRRDDSVPTFQTNGKEIRYNQAFADELTDGELRYILCHEIMHCSNGHLWRMAGRDVECWNKACDYVINQMLDDYEADCRRQGFPVPWSRPKGMLDIADKPQWRGLSPEQIYNDMRQAQQPPPPDDQPGQPGEPPPPDPSAPPQPGQPDPSAPPQPGQPPQPGKPDPNAPPNPGQPGPGDFEAPPEDEPQAGQEPGAESGLEEDWEIATVQAERIANMKGNCPGAASHLCDEIKAPKVSWRDVLREFMRQHAKADYSFARPNRRHLQRGFILPGLHSEKMGRLVCAFDSSGSTRRFVGDFQAEVQAALDEVQPERIDVIVCDANIQHVQSFEPGDTVTIDAKGGGGTDFRPVFEHIEGDPEADEPPVCVVYLTDLDGSYPSVAPDYPVLWCVPEQCRSRKVPPFGEVVGAK